MKTKSLLLTIIATLGMTALTMAQNVPSYVPTNGLVGWWPFNGNANDESGNGNNGVVNGATLTNDRFGNALNAFNFDGNQNRIEVHLDSALNGNTTISVWYYSLSLNGGPFVHIGQDNPGSQYCDGYDIGKGGTTLNNQGNDLISGFSCIGYYDSEIPTQNAQWNNAVLIKTANQIQIFLNGSLVYTQTTTNPINPSPFLYFASTSPVVSTLFEGTLDDIGIYNRALTQEEITALYTGVPTDNNSEGNNAAATVPAAISYQAIARNTQGHTLSDTDIQVKFTLLADSLTGAAEYSESHALATNSLGLFTTAFGAGTAEIGTFAGINWASGSKYLKVELDAGDGFVDMGTQQLLSVPFSMRSNTSAKAGTIENSGLPVYADNAAALAGGLVAGQIYRTATGDLKIVY